MNLLVHGLMKNNQCVIALIAKLKSKNYHLLSAITTAGNVRFVIKISETHHNPYHQ